MATVTEPIVLDKSINTTENPSRNIADVLAEELARIAGAITTAENVEDILTDMATTKNAQIISGTAVFETVDGNLVKALKVAVTPSQAGSGTPSPSNVRPISGYTEEVISVKDSTDTTQMTYTIPFGQTVYGGTLDVRSGELTIEKVCESFTSAEYYGTYGSDHAPLFYVTTSNNLIGYTSVSDPQSNRLISNIYNAITVSNYTQMPNNEIRTQYGDTVNRVYIRDDRFSSKAEIDAYLTNNPVQIVGRLATPTTIYLTPQTVKALAGENHISASTGDVTECKYSMMINGDDLVQLLA